MTIDFLVDYVLENERAMLRPLLTDDFAHLQTFALVEPDLWKYSAISAAGSEGMQNYIRSALAGRAAQKEYPFIVFDKLTNQYAGSTRLYDIQPANNMLQLGFTWYGSQHQRTGLNRHCKWLLLQFAFETLKVDRVEFRADNNNARSIAAMQAIGCTVEGILRSNMPKSTGGRRDSIVLSILKDEWFGGIRQMLHSKVNG